MIIRRLIYVNLETKILFDVMHFKVMFFFNLKIYFFLIIHEIDISEM